MTDKKNITWLASYPKSGNTWFRIFLSNFVRDCDHPADINQLDKTPIASSRKLFDEAVGIDAADLSFDEIDRLRPDLYRYLSRESDEMGFYKIHDAYTYLDTGEPLFPTNATKKAIYIIRNPLDIAISFANHSGISVDESIAHMNNPGYCFCHNPQRQHIQLRQQLLSWSGHVRSWTTARGLDLHLLRYEDMKESPTATFTHAVKFLGLDPNPERISKALAFSSFSRLQQQEQENGFQERHVACQAFFHKGVSGYWREVLNPRQIDAIITHHHETMKQYGYLNALGNPT